ncbi:hypothetical protein K438DRAFT_1771738 [Mycena galopus ATCC 62051]|nr:hypothetical protein K438DRAFT_1771738 [Mycena galopus ATCC 62051]
MGWPPAAATQNERVRIRTARPGHQGTPPLSTGSHRTRSVKDDKDMHMKRKRGRSLVYVLGMAPRCPGQRALTSEGRKKGQQGREKTNVRVKNGQSPSWLARATRLLGRFSSSSVSPPSISPLRFVAEPVEMERKRSKVGKTAEEERSLRVSVGKNEIVNVSFEARSRQRKWTKEDGGEGRGEKGREGKEREEKSRQRRTHTVPTALLATLRSGRTEARASTPRRRYPEGRRTFEETSQQREKGDMKKRRCEHGGDRRGGWRRERRRE